MKTIAFIYGSDSEFPKAIIDNINDKKLKTINAEQAVFDITMTGANPKYEVIFEMLSVQIPFYRSILKTAALNGVKVVNNPFWSCIDDNFFHIELSEKIKIKSPKTAIIPSKHRPAGVDEDSLRNMKFPLEWDALFDFIGFPAYLKSNRSGNNFQEYKVYDSHEFFSAYDISGENLMIVQESIDYDEYYKVWCTGKKEVFIVAYDPSKPNHLRYNKEKSAINSSTREKLSELSLNICESLGYDFTSIEFAIKGKDIYAMNYLNSFTEITKMNLGEENFHKLVEMTSSFLIEVAKKRKTASDTNWKKILQGNSNKK